MNIKNSLNDIRCDIGQHNHIYNMTPSVLIERNGYRHFNILISVMMCNNCRDFYGEEGWSDGNNLFDLDKLMEHIKHINNRTYKTVECWRHFCGYIITEEEIKIFEHNKNRLIRECRG